jgi:hypothetical protein
MQTYTNASSVPLSLAVFLATDHYDHDATTISATSLIKPLRQIILGSRVDTKDAFVDLVNMVPSRMGTAIHDGIERAWMDNHETAMLALGYPQKIIDRIRINPVGADRKLDGIIPIYLEQRSQKQVGKYLVSGKFDFVGDGRVEDFKSTSTFTATNNTNDEKYILQGSIYRWLNPDIITKDEMAIQFIFTDWSAMRAKSEPGYPQQRIQQRVLPLLSIEATDHYVRSKLAQVDRYMDVEEQDIPPCSDQDLWRSAPVFKYYKNPDKTVRSTKNFDTKQEAYIRLAEEGGQGVVIEKPGQVTACKYCNAFTVCTQKDALIAQGDLIL